MPRAKKDEILKSDAPFNKKLRITFHLSPWVRNKLRKQEPSPGLWLERHLKELWSKDKPGRKN